MFPQGILGQLVIRGGSGAQIDDPGCGTCHRGDEILHPWIVEPVEAGYESCEHGGYAGIPCLGGLLRAVKTRAEYPVTSTNSQVEKGLKGDRAQYGLV